jgi:hypothetical protein
MRTGLAIALVMAFGLSARVGLLEACERRGGSSEVRVEQARGSLPAGAAAADLRTKPAKGAPETGASTGAAVTGPTAPVTCNQQNASSPACYSATQQARPVTK